MCSVVLLSSIQGSFSLRSPDSCVVTLVVDAEPVPTIMVKPLPTAPLNITFKLIVFGVLTTGVDVVEFIRLL